MPEFVYDAFISYRRSDGGKVARWLRRELEGYRVPKSMRDRFGRKLRIYIDTAYERGSSDFYEQSVKPPLMSSHFLLVVATPDAMHRSAAAEDWINREIRDFVAGPNGSNVIAIRGAGDFDGPLPGGLLDRFPNIEIIDLRGAGRFWFLNPMRAVRLASEKLKLVAPLLGIPFEEMPAVRQEEEKRQQTRLGGVAGATLGVLAAVSGLSAFALESRFRALRAAEDSMYAAGGMATQAAALSNADDNTAQVRGLIINQGCDLIDKFRRDAVVDPAVAQFVMCRVERARHREQLEEYDDARQQYAAAIEFARSQHERLQRMEAGLGLVRARQAYAEYLVRRKDAAAEAEYGKLLDESRQLAAGHEGRLEFARSEAEGLGRIGDLLVARGERNKAFDSYSAAASVVSQKLIGTGNDGGKVEPWMVAWLARLHRLAGVQLVQNDRGQAVEQFHQSLAVATRIKSDKTLPSVEIEFAVTNALLLAAEIDRGEIAAARVARQAGLASVDRIVNSDASPELKQRAARVKRSIESQKIAD